MPLTLDPIAVRILAFFAGLAFLVTVVIVMLALLAVVSGLANRKAGR